MRAKVRKTKTRNRVKLKKDMCSMSNIGKHINPKRQQILKS